MTTARRLSGAPMSRPAAMLFLSLLLLCTLAGPPAVVAAPDAYAEVLPERRGEVRAETTGELSAYAIDATLDADAATIAGTAEVAFRNDAPVALPEVYFRLYPNADYYGEGDLTIEAARVEGQPVEATLAVEGTALRVPLPAPLAPGGTAEIDLEFVTTVPTDSDGSYGIFQRDTVDGTWILADWHPVLAVYEPGVGWRIDAPTAFGDPTFAASALYDVTFAAPADLLVVASGVVAEEVRRDGLVARRFVAGPAREFTLVVDDDYVATDAAVGGTTVTAYTEPEDAAAGEAAVEVAADALEVFGEAFGPYPFAELDLVQTRLAGALAVSWAGIVFLDGPSLLGDFAERSPNGFETVVAHEIAHLWWGASVGSNSNDHTFVNEGLATLSSILYLERTAGPEAAAAERERWIIAPARRLLERGDAVVDLPIRDGQDEGERAAAYYAKGALGFLAIRAAIGDEAFAAGLRDFAATYEFGIAEPSDLRAAWEAASGQDLDELWRHWFEAAEMTAEEIEALG